MKIMKALMVSLILPLAIFCGCARNFSPFIPSVNNAPVINSVLPSSTTVDLNASAVISAKASDIDGETLNYTWTCSGGVITGSGSSVTWRAPGTQGAYAVSVTVSDGRPGGLVSNTTNLTVVNSLYPGNHDPIITSAVADTYDAVVGQVVTVTCTASDPDGDTLTYTWGDNFIHSYPDSSVITATLCCSNPLNLQVIVSDGKGGSAVYHVPTITFHY